VQWLILKYGMSYKGAKINVVKQMVEAIVDENDLLGLGVQCSQIMKPYAIGFNTVVKKAKLAASLYMSLH
jgi:hypothetical protein